MGAFSGPKWVISTHSRGAEFFFFSSKILHLSLLSIPCHLTPCKKSVESNEWFVRYIDFFVWSVNYWPIFFTFFKD